jgi:hypothetical protein
MSPSPEEADKTIQYGTWLPACMPLENYVIRADNYVSVLYTISLSIWRVWDKMAVCKRI